MYRMKCCVTHPVKTGTWQEVWRQNFFPSPFTLSFQCPHICSDLSKQFSWFCAAEPSRQQRNTSFDKPLLRRQQRTTQPISSLFDKETSLRFSPDKVLRTAKKKETVRSRDIQIKVTSQCVGDIIDLSTKDPFHRSRKGAGVREW